MHGAKVKILKLYSNVPVTSQFLEFSIMS